MKALIVLLTIITPLLMYVLKVRTKQSQFIFNSLAIIAIFTFSLITATFLYQILAEHALFTTKIHGIFLNPLFLISGSYLGVYIIYRLIILTINERTL